MSTTVTDPTLALNDTPVNPNVISLGSKVPTLAVAD
jgi:hypothetical protein